LSGQFLQRNLFAAVDAILGAIVTSHTHCVDGRVPFQLVNYCERRACLIPYRSK